MWPFINSERSKVHDNLGQSVGIRRKGQSRRPHRAIDPLAREGGRPERTIPEMLEWKVEQVEKRGDALVPLEVRHFDFLSGPRSR
jgi:hypothetical protein